MKHPQIWIIWGNWGPYHHARLTALRSAAKEHGIIACGIEITPKSDDYAWDPMKGEDHFLRLMVNRREMDFRPFRLAARLWPLLRRERPIVVFVPAYWHWSLLCNLMARLAGAKVVMMNESHAGTERATGLKRWLKRQIVRRFHAAFVGGTPQRRHFAALGIPEDRIAIGYDAVDNLYFSTEAARVRTNADVERSKWRLPNRYVLSLGRIVGKKNLTTLVEAFRLLRQETNPVDPAELVIVGSGPLEGALRDQCRSLGLEVVDRLGKPPFDAPPASTNPRVFFYGFRQIHENPVFYALAAAFVLPSSHEEWGLVVNEAMASGLPVIVSKNVGCVEDLIVDGENGWTFDPSSPAELASCLARIDGAPELAERMGRRSTGIIANWGCEAFAEGALAAVKICAPELIEEKE